VNASVINKSPQRWLAEVRALTQGLQHVRIPEWKQIEEGFMPVPAPTVMRFDRLPHSASFIRAVATQSKFATPQDQWGVNWWADSRDLATIYGQLEQFEGFLTDQEVRKLVGPRYREVTAIAFRWSLDPREVTNDFGHAFELSVDDNGPIEGIVGRVAPKKKFPDMTSPFPFLRGGARQALLYVPMGFRIREIRL
jgi:hypothetical protein